MRRTRTRGVVTAAGIAVAVTLSACHSGGSTKAAGKTQGAASSARGGTIYYSDGTKDVEHWDPQRTYIGRDIANMSRLFTRTLVQYGAGAGAASNRLHPDLATDLGRASAGNTIWKFTLKTGITWEDGSPVTCADVKYGVSRTFATDVITGGPNYAIQFLDIPAETNATAAKTFPSAYHGPYDNVGAALYDKAVTCSGQTITFHLKKPVPDFNFATTLPEFAPFKKSKDQGGKSNYLVFSDGPYKLSGSWVKGKGGTFVRNPDYDPKTDDPTIRRALPDKIQIIEGIAVETLFDRLLADQGQDKTLVTDRQAPPAYLARIATQGARYTDPASPYVYYLVPNFKRMTNPLVRQALAVATDRQGYVLAEGGSAVASPTHGLIAPALGTAGGYKKFSAFDTPDTGDPAKARALLQQAGVTIPYPIHYTYSGGTPTADKQAAALAAGWEKAGFKVTLEGLTNTYYDIVQNPSNASKYDVTYGGWGADWPNASTVIPPLFDSRVNLTSATNGQDYGLFSDAKVNAAIDRAYRTTDATARNAMWGDLDEQLAKDVAYIPLEIDRFPRLHGSDITNYVESASTNGFPDLGQLGVRH